MPQNYFSYQIIKTSFPLLNFENRKSCNSGQNFWIMFWWYNEKRQENGFLGLFLFGNFEKSLTALSVHPLLPFSDDEWGVGVCGGGGAWVVKGSVHGRGGVHGGGHAWQGVCIVGMCMAGDMHGMHAPWQIMWDTVNERVVHILLEYILVLSKYQNFFSSFEFGKQKKL